MDILITEKTDMTPLLVMDWMKIQTNNRKDTTGRNQPTGTREIIQQIYGLVRD